MNATATAETNPLLAEWNTPFGLPPFDRIKPEHFRPAFDVAFAGHRAEIDAIAGDPEPPTFANTIDALELAGERLSRVGGVFWNLSGSHTNPETPGDRARDLARRRQALQRHRHERGAVRPHRRAPGGRLRHCRSTQSNAASST